MVKVNGKNYTTEYIQRAVAALEAAGVKDDGTDRASIILCDATEKGEIQAILSLDEYHSVFVNLEANADQCRTLRIRGELPQPGHTYSLPLATIEAANASTDGKGSYVVETGKPFGCPRIFLYNRLDDECSHIVLTDGEGMETVQN